MATTFLGESERNRPETSEIRRADVRLHPRYPIQLDLQYGLISPRKGRRTQPVGFGRTVNLSSRGVLFEADNIRSVTNIAVGSSIIELRLDWPLMLEEQCMLKLVVRGLVVRQDGDRLALVIERYEFRTAGKEKRVLAKTDAPARAL